MKKTTLHMIGNAHIDPVWLWQWHEGFHEVKATFRSALDRMKEFEDFIFEAAFVPGEIKTFRIPRDPTLPVVETSLLEWGA